MKFWIVTSLRGMPNPGLGDICYLTDIHEFMLITLGGLKPKDVIGVYPEDYGVEAREHGGKVLREE